MKCIVTATIWVQEWKSKNDPVDIMTITHNKLFFTTGSHKRSSHLNTTACKLECSGQELPKLGHRIQAVSLRLFNILNVTEVSCTDNFPHQKISNRWIINAPPSASENLNSDATEGTASQRSLKQPLNPHVPSFAPSQGLPWLKGQTGKTPFPFGLLLF